jgi:hypothetical protein
MPALIERVPAKRDGTRTRQAMTVRLFFYRLRKHLRLGRVPLSAVAAIASRACGTGKD